MSRHRFVRNLDLDAEMADEEEEQGMTAEEQAQLATSMPIARALLKDIKPRISDDAIADSLWHYWFDVDKAVIWLRKDWEKKGGSVPPHLIPTPDQQRRRRSAKSPRNGPGPSSSTSPDVVQPALTALQRLSLARKSALQSQETKGTAAPGRPSGSGATTPLGSSADAGGSTPAKPMSKLALLAQRRKEEAAAAAMEAKTASVSEGATTPGAGPSSTALPERSGKPLSKLAQKMATARAGQSDGSSLPQNMAVDAMNEDVHTSIDEDDTGLFPTSASGHHTLHSPFFETLTSTARQRHPEPATLAMNAHFPTISLPDEVDRRIRSTFGEGAESPDDVVLRARQGRGGAAAPATPTTAAAAAIPVGIKANGKTSGKAKT